jgi:tetratricopeptide (TPR) repeat protein
MKLKFSIIIVITSIAISTLLGQTKLDKIKEMIKQKQFNDAVIACQIYLQSNTRDENGWLLLAKTYQQYGKLDSAETAAKKAIDVEDEMMEGYTVLSNIQRAMKKPLEAISTARAGLKMTRKKQPEYPPLLVELAWSLSAADSADAAQVAAAKAKESDPQNPAPYEIMGDAYAKQKVAPMAISSYEKSLELDSTQLRVHYKLANTYKSERQYTQAALVFSRILGLDTKNDDARLELARLFFRAKQYVKCSQTLKTYFETNKNPAEDIQSMYLEALFLSKQFTPAYEVAKEFLKRQPNSVLANRAYAFGLYIDKQYPQAIDAFNKLATVDTLDFDDYRWLGNAYRQTKKDSLAAITYEEALKDTTQSIANRSYMLGEVGTIWMKFKSWERAASNFEKRILIDTTAVGASINYAMCMIQLDQFEKAISALKNAIIRNPKYPPAYINLGFCYFQMKDYDAGQKEFETAVKVIDTAEVKYRLELADSYRMIALAIMVEKKSTMEESQKKWESAISYLKKSLKYKEDMAQAHLLLGQCYQNLNKIDDAIKEYKRVLQLEPKHKEAQKYLDDLLKLK